ncbi:MAG: hypothetical protein U1D41_13415 [Nitrosomonas sp.]|nr:hypothetical protein [Nitrosomonas sp.]MDP3662642.1 hypothetical protein [Nitrosomonas sp.]MDZ4107127.1 hypothetical protein [Nitrosomonas sp.]
MATSAEPSERPYSSIHRYIKANVIANDWSGVINRSGEGGYGER